MRLFPSPGIAVAALFFTIACGGERQQIDDTRSAIEARWNSPLTLATGELRFIGGALSNHVPDEKKGEVPLDVLPLYKAAESQGLIRIVDERDLTGEFTGWSDFYQLSQIGVQKTARMELTPRGREHPVEVRAGREYLRISVWRAAVTEIVANDSMRIGADRYQLVLGYSTAEIDPNYRDALRAVGDTFGRDRRFRALLRYDAFAKRWSYLVADLASRSAGFPTAYVDQVLAMLRRCEANPSDECASFIRRLESTQSSDSSSSAENDASAGTSKGPAGNVAAQRCAESFREHPLPRPALLDRLRGRTVSAAASLPDSVIVLKNYDTMVPNAGRDWVGAIGYLASGDICVGQHPVMSANGADTDFPIRMGAVELSSPSPSGFRLLALSDGDFGPQHAWIVHPDSVRPLTTDLQTRHVGPIYSAFSFYASWGIWSPDERFFITPGNGGGLLIADLRQGVGRFVFFDELLSRPRKENCWALELEMDSLRWMGSEAVQLPIRYVYYSEGGDNPEESCPRAERMSAVAQVDLTHGRAAAVR